MTQSTKFVSLKELASGNKFVRRDEKGQITGILVVIKILDSSFLCSATYTHEFTLTSNIEIIAE